MLSRIRIHAPLLVLLFLAVCVRSAFAEPTNWDRIQTRAAERFGQPGAQAAAFLAAHRPERDEHIDPDFVIEHIRLALEARERFPWARSLPDDLFLNDVLPYAVLDEDRLPARDRLLPIAAEIVDGATTAEDAAQRLNRDLFPRLGVRYSTARNRANQGSIETMDTGLASCTGLSILLVDACRSVGIPARLAGIAFWPGRGGNHTWVEIHDGQRWRFTGAAEYDANGLDRAWFTGQTAGAIPAHELHGVWATSWASTGHHYPLVWAPADRTVPGVDVTDRYIGPRAKTDEPRLAVRLWTTARGPRLAAEVTRADAPDAPTSRTHADPDDINRVAELPDPGARPLTLRLTADGQSRLAFLDESHTADRVIDLRWDELGLEKSDAQSRAAAIWAEHAERLRTERSAELESMSLSHADHTMRLLRRDFGQAEHGQRSLWISMHGGGGTTPAVNDQQWRNQIRLYEPEEGIYIAPRAPTDTWNLWHRPEIDALFDRLIESAVIVWGVDPDRIYLMGYSAGGDGVYQLAPRMADRFAAAAMMAGHPNDARPEGLRNLPFALFMGANDTAFNRNTVAAQWGERLAALQATDPDGYTHLVRIYPDLGHWMDRKDAEGVPWMAAFRRNPWPSKVVWRQGNTTHPRFAWLAVDESAAAPGRQIVASVDGQTITLESDDLQAVTLLLHDRLIDLDQPITVIANTQRVFEGFVPRTESAMRESLRLRPDPNMIAAAMLRIELPAAATAPPP